MSSTTQPLNLSGVVVTDVRSLHWRIGAHIGSGGFGSIYLACEANSGLLERGLGVPDDTRMAIKVEPHDNGSLFTEMHFYHRCAKLDKMEEWQRQRGLDYVGMPRLHGSGSFLFRRQRYRFIVIDRFGTDLQVSGVAIISDLCVFEANLLMCHWDAGEERFLRDTQPAASRVSNNDVAIGRCRLLTTSQTILGCNEGRMPLKTALTVAIRVTDILEYVHFHGYVHKDVKAQNLLLGFDDPNKIYLVDFGLACRYFVYESGYEVHKELKEDLRRAHDGTIEFTSRDGHLGAHSRRSDLEVLLYNLIYWISGKLPWSSNREEAEDIASQKEIYMRDPQELMIVCFGRKGAPPYILEFANYIARLDFHEKPNYELCREMFKQAILKSGFRHDMQLQFEGGVVRIQSKRKCRKSFRLEKEKRLRVEQESQASLSSSSSGSIAATRLRRRTTQVAGTQVEPGATTTDDDDNDSSLSDRPSSVKRSCFDSRHSSGRRTGRHHSSITQDQEVPQDRTQVIIDPDTKETRVVDALELREAQRAFEQQRENAMKAAWDELRQMDESAAKAEAARATENSGRRKAGGVKSAGSDGESGQKPGHQRPAQRPRATRKAKKLRQVKQSRLARVAAVTVAHNAVRETTGRATRQRTLREQVEACDIAKARDGSSMASQDGSTGTRSEKVKRVALASGAARSDQTRTSGTITKYDKARIKESEPDSRGVNKKGGSKHVRFKEVQCPGVVVGMSLRNRRLPLTEVSNSKGESSNTEYIDDLNLITCFSSTRSVSSVASPMANGCHNSNPFPMSNYFDHKPSGLENPTPAMQLLMDKLKIKLHSLVNSGPPVMPLSFKDRILDAGDLYKADNVMRRSRSYSPEIA
ncbi:serine/threonine-protein kinase VRK1-like [Tropilaelaps mercedesae]|uniref:non-specific serine/threonine protein kinase n=1 Tax=Tropilaelaps mercedesae TaxID=418985 RepID=A0A1V9Y0M4_9ACAR|nr:serine/threonine-protein kinase VRK1-like [Tropilaelaps mercedesae]